MGISTVRQVFPPLTEFTNTRVIAPATLHINDQLKMQVRRPVAVLMRLTEMSECFASFYPFSFNQIVKIFQRQMSVQTMKMKVIAFMLKYDRSAIITVMVVECEAMNSCIDRC